MMIVKIFDTKTYKVIWTLQDSRYSNFYWMVGNGSCDCNRRLSFNREIEKVDDIDEPCLSERYYIIDKIDFEINKNELPYNYTYDYDVFHDYNQGYYTDSLDVLELLEKLNNRATKINNLLLNS